MNDYSVKDFMKTVFNPFDKNLNENSKYKNYIFIVRILIAIQSVFNSFNFSATLNHLNHSIVYIIT